MSTQRGLGLGLAATSKHPRDTPSWASPCFRCGSMWAQHLALLGNMEKEALNDIHKCELPSRGDSRPDRRWAHAGAGGSPSHLC